MHHEYEPPIDEPTEEASAELEESDVAPIETPVMASEAPPAKVKQVAASTIADVPTTPIEIIRAIIATKVRKPLDQVDESRSIKELCGGAFMSFMVKDTANII